MTSLSKVVLGTAPTGSDGDPVRTGFTKANSNVDVLNAQATLTSAAASVTTAQALTAALHLGRRVNIALAVAGIVQLPAASTCVADGVILLRNIGTTVVTLAITTGSGDTVALSKLNPGETALLDVDGVHTWSVLMRGRTNSDNETVNGNCTVNGNETVGGTFSATGAATLASTLAVTGATTLTGGVTGGPNFSARPTFAGSVPWDAANLVGPATLAGTQTFTGAKTFSVRPVFNGQTPWDSANFNPALYLPLTGGQLTNQLLNSVNPSGGAWNNAAIVLNPSAGGLGVIGFGSNAGAAAGSLRLQTTAVFEFVNGTGGSYAPVSCSTLTQTSDRDLKDDIRTITGALDKVKQLRGVSYSMSGVSSVGVIAQEVQPVFPELVTELGITVGDRPALGVNYPQMVGPLIEAIKELSSGYDSLLSRLSALESKAPA